MVNSLSEVVDRWGITNAQASELFILTGTIDATYTYAILLYHGIPMDDIRWLFKSGLLHIFKVDDWPAIAQFIRSVSETCGLSGKDVLRALLELTNALPSSEAPLAAIQFLSLLRNAMENDDEPSTPIPTFRCIRVTEEAEEAEEET